MPIRCRLGDLRDPNSRQGEFTMQLEQHRGDVDGVRKHGLDIVRAAAIAAVMLYHANVLQLVPTPTPWIVSFGWMGVDLFFVLSGYLIGSQLLKPFASGAKPNYRRFFGRRAFRTLPAFAMILLVYFAFPPLREAPDIQPWWQFLTFTENLLFDPSTPKAFDHVWSLCVEEQFYLVFPLVVALFAAGPSTRKAVAIVLAVLGAGIALRSLLWLTYVARPAFSLSGATDWHTYVAFIYYPTWSRLDGLLAGVSIALLKIFKPTLWVRLVARPNLLLSTGLVGILAAIFVFGGAFGAPTSVAFGFPLLSLSVALIVAAATTGQAFLGKYRIPGAEALAAGAYSLYLSHKIAFHATIVWLAPSLGVTGGARFLLSIMVALICGAILYWAIERPFLQLRHWLDAKSGNPKPDKHRRNERSQSPIFEELAHPLRSSPAALRADGY